MIASIAEDLTAAIAVEVGRAANGDAPDAGLSETEMLHRLADQRQLVHATPSGMSSSSVTRRWSRSPRGPTG